MWDGTPNGRGNLEPEEPYGQHRPGWLIVDGPNARILELSVDGRVLGLGELPRQLLPQTEGVTFGVDGTLYLASQGHRGLAVLAAYIPAPSGPPGDGAARR